MGPKKGRRVRKIEVPSDSVPQFELGDTVAYIQEGGVGGKKNGRKRHRNRPRRKPGGRRQEGRKLHTPQRREWQKSVQGQTKVTQK